MDCNKILNDIAVKAENDRINKPYIDENGIKRCPVCNEPVEFELNVGGKYGTGKRPIACKCQLDKAEAEKAERLADDRKRKVAEIQTKAFTDRRQCEITFDKADNLQTNEMETAAFYVEHWEDLKAKGIGLLMIGNIGSGKTFTALCIANALVDKLVNVRYVTSGYFVNEVMSNSTVNKNACIKEYANSDLLILDDLGAEFDNPYTTQYIFQLINECYSNNTPIIVTTNLSLEHFDTPKDEQHKRIYDRIRGRTLPVSITGESRRKKEGEEALAEARELYAEWKKGR